jgi:hypothetical protein
MSRRTTYSALSALAALGVWATGREVGLQDSAGLAGQSAIEELAVLRGRLFPQVERPIQWPEPALVLDLESRRDSELRSFKHLHQVCVLHREHFWAGQIKHLSLIDAYLDLAGSQNGLALYIIARSMFELSAFFHAVRSRLIEASEHAEVNWREAGQMFFAAVVRARFATTREDYKTLLRDEARVSPKRLDPFNVMHCIRGLAQDAENNDAEARYAFLCDFVHHNLASATTANAGSAEVDVASSSGAGMAIMPHRGAITQYEYPLPDKYVRALDDTCPGFLRDALSCVRWLNETPAGPYPPQLVEQMTGAPLGLTVLEPLPEPSRPKGSERNQPCPCGSGIKYKRCCAAPA